MHIIQMHIPKRINNPQKYITPAGIILHYIGNPGTSARQNAKYFHSVNTQVSVNYVVDDDEIIELIPPYMKSYGTSSGEYNGRFIQIEMCHPDESGRISEATLDNTVGLCRELMAKYGISEIIRHYDVTGKRCPLWYVVHPDEWAALLGRIKEGGKKEEKPMEKASDNTPAEWARKAVEWAKESGILRGDETGDLRLRDGVTREELCVMLYRFSGGEK